MKKTKRRNKMPGHYGMKKDKKKRKGMMYGGEGMRKQAKHGGPHKNMDRIGMAMGGAMDVQEPN
jgi:hypothetical protein